MDNKDNMDNSNITGVEEDGMELTINLKGNIKAFNIRA